MRTPQFARTVILACTLVSANGCTFWSPRLAPVAEVIAEKPGAVRVHRANLAPTSVFAPRIDGDTLRSSDARNTIAIALADIRAVDVRRGDGANTVVLLLVGLIGGIPLVLSTTW